MKADDHRIPPLLKTDAEELGRSASLPAAHSMLWKAKIRAARTRRQRVVALIALTEMIGAGAVALICVRLVWTTLFNTPVIAHALTVVVAAVLTMVAIAVIATAPFIALRSKST
jgi:hypothetical protein